MRKKYTLFLGLGLFFIIIAIWQINAAQIGLDIINLPASNPPITIISPSNVDSASRPTILIAHGFAGSSVLMRGFALTLAHAGYTTVSWDFQGHGTNPNPLNSSSRSDNLLADAESAFEAAANQGLIDTKRVAILGHSMGSGVAFLYGIAHPDTGATIAVSPVFQTVTPDLPHNLLLMAGSLEPQFVSNAEQLLDLSGGLGGETSNGTAHKLVIIPDVEHISILFSPNAHRIARSWLSETFGSQPGASDYIDRRIYWFGLGILGFILLTNAIINLVPASEQIMTYKRPLWLRILAVITGGISATIILWLVSLGGIKINQMLGLLVGGYLIIWFGVAGIVSLLILKPQFSKPAPRELASGLIAFAGLWLGVGLLGNFIWLPWILIPARFLLWFPGSIILLPWFFTIGYEIKGSKPASLLGWWIFQVFTIIVCLLLAIRISPDLGFLYIILPLVPVLIGLHMLVISSKHGTWAYAMSGAMFTAWLILAVFPLQ
jgi:pimeloyl-ACP methyl ester carboxylesterase